MYEEINKKILETKAHMRERERLQSLVRRAEASLMKEEKRRQELKEILDKEEMDVTKIEGLSIRNLFFTILGSKTEKLEKEKEEFLAAKLKFDECCNSINNLKSEIESYYSQLRSLGYSNYSYQDLLRQKEELILSSNDTNAKDIMALTEESAALEADIKELTEAMSAGKDVLKALDNANNSLNSAEGWGTWDMLGGGLIATAAKHSHIDDSVSHINAAKSYLNRFIRELSDVNLSVDVNVGIDSFDKFADYFFDGLIADWNVQNKINNSQSSVRSAYRRVETVMEDLKPVFKEKERKLENIKLQIKSIIENAGAQ